VIKITLDTTEIRQWTERMKALGRARLVPVVHDEVGTVYDGAVAGWPVRSGRSKAGLALETFETGARIDNPVTYAEWVRPPEYPGSVTAVDRLIALPMLEVAERCVDRMVELVAEEARRG
jgi:hypothetical protein